VPFVGIFNLEESRTMRKQTDGNIQEKLKIVLVGPVYPYKGGIAHYTSLMYRALAKKHEIKMLSYKMQYPKLLFKKEQRDYDNDMFKIEDTEFKIHTANPFNMINVGKYISKWKPDVVIVQWWHPYFAPCYYLLSKCLRHTKILFICHNVFPHERFPLDRKLTKVALKQGNCYIVQSKQDEEDLKTLLKNPVYARTVHPTYHEFKYEGMTKDRARGLLNIGPEDKVLLFFGFIREYKGLKHLIKAMPIIKERFSDARLLIVGDFGEDKQNYLELIAENRVETVIDIYDGYIPDREVEKYFAACDLVVLPYESATQSGIVQIAYGFEKPVIVTDVGGLPDVVTDGKTGYVVSAKKPEKLAEAVIRYYENEMEEEFVNGVKEEAYRFSWDRMVETIEKIIQTDYV